MAPGHYPFYLEVRPRTAFYTVISQVGICLSARSYSRLCALLTPTSSTDFFSLTLERVPAAVENFIPMIRLVLLRSCHR